jgi:hypothetical protein
MGGFFLILAFCLSTWLPKTEERVFIHLCTNLAFVVKSIVGFYFLKFQGW